MNDDRSKRVFSKTSAGRAALADRRLSGKTRAALILVNGRDSVHDLRMKLGLEVERLLNGLRQSGFVEAVPMQQPTQQPQQSQSLQQFQQAKQPQTPTPPQARLGEQVAATSLPTPADEAERLAPLKRVALGRLAPHFGLDVGLFAAPLLAATSAAAFNLALARIESRLALYLGKAHAARVLVGLRP